MSDVDTCVWIDPARRSGEPCVGGSRIDVEMAVGTIWAHGIDEALSQWPHLTRGGLLNACWYAAVGNVVRLHGKGGKYVAHRGPWRKRWGTWASDVHQALWESRYGDVPDPPERPVKPRDGSTDTRDTPTGAHASAEGDNSASEPHPATTVTRHETTGTQKGDG